KVLRRLGPREVDSTARQKSKLPPMATSTPHIPADRVPYQVMETLAGTWETPEEGGRFAEAILSPGNDFASNPGTRNKVPDALSRNPLQSDELPMDILPEYAIIGGLELRFPTTLPLSDRSQVRELQLEDPITGDLLRMMETSTLSNERAEECSQFSIHDGLLYFNDPTPACGIHPLKQLKLYVPESLKETVLKYYHDHPTAGHLGMTKTLARLRHRFFWPKMSSEVKKYVSSCKLQSSLREAHEHAKASLEISHTKRKEHYDRKRRCVYYSIGDLVRVKTHPKSDALANFTAKLAPLYSGPYCVVQVLSDVNYRLRKLDTGEDAGVFHVVNMQPFHSRLDNRVNERDGFSHDSDILDGDNEFLSQN
ncbi:hypothetical protein DNTS_023931, partial [Danionella cerebrum]